MKRAGVFLSGAIVAVAITASAHASADSEQGLPTPERCDVGARNAISTQPLSLLARGAAVMYERFVAPPTVSVVGLAGVRGAATGDYASTTFDAGVEARAWMLGRRISHCERGAMVGPYLGLRMDVGYTSLRDTITSRAAGTSVDFDPTFFIGYRFVLWRVVELTPSLGAGARIDDDGLALQARPTLTFGLSIGWMF
jgi:hypothetical protein